MLSVLDRKWREHLYEMDYLREGIGLRAYSQRDPLVEYQREGFDMFNAMMDGIKEESVAFLFNLEVQVEEEDEAGDERCSSRRSSRPRSWRSCSASLRSPTQPVIKAKGLEERKAPADLTYTAPTETGDAEVRHGAAGARRGRPVRHRGPQRPVPLRLGQEVQALPRRPGRPDRDRPPASS